MRRLFKVGVLAAATMVAVGIAPVHAGATPPQVERFEDSLEFVAPCSAFGRDFDALLQLDLKGTSQLFFDSSGTPIRLQVHLNFDGTQTNIDPLTAEPTGEVFALHHAFTDTIDLTTGATTTVGLPFGMWEEHGPPVVMDRGRIVQDADGNIVFLAGPHPVAVDLGFNPCLAG